MQTLNDYFKLSKDPYQKGAIADLLRFTDLARIVPIESVPALRLSATRWQTLPSAAFRKFGGGYSESTGTTEQITETLAVLGGDIKVDRLGNKGQFITDPLVDQMKMKMKAVAFKLNDAFVNGDQASDPDSFEGLKKRVAGMPARQTVWLDSAADGTGTSLDVLASDANMQTFLDALHKVIKRVDGANALFCNEVVYLALGRVLRRLKLNTVMKDAYDHEWDAFQGVPLVDVGLKSDKSTEIISSTEAPGSVSSSIYAVRMDTDDGVRLIQLEGAGGPNVYDPLKGGEMESGPQYLRRIDWPLGMFHRSQYVICRLAGFKFTA